MEIPCSHCGRFFTPSSRHKNQIYCLRSPCRRARKAAWQREKMHTDSDYRANQRTSQATWAARNPGYWKQYRKRNPHQAERNRILQTLRNRKARTQHDRQDGFVELDCKDGRVIKEQFPIVGQYLLVPVIAKMDALKVNIFVISNSYV
jgi:hypothetical protein